MDKETRGLLDRTAIVETIDRLFIATDRRDWKAVRACLAARVLFDMSSLDGGKPATLSAGTIVDAWEKGLRPIEAIHHQAGNYLVEIRGSRATAFCYGIASHYLPNHSGRNTRIFVGSYDFSLERAGGRWRISAFRFNLKYIDGNRELENAAKETTGKRPKGKC